jgi:hypothetical protein
MNRAGLRPREEAGVWFVGDAGAVRKTGDRQVGSFNPPWATEREHPVSGIVTGSNPSAATETFRVISHDSARGTVSLR